MVTLTLPHCAYSLQQTCVADTAEVEREEVRIRGREEVRIRRGEGGGTDKERGGRRYG